MLDRGWAVIVDFLEGSNALVDQSWVVSLGDVVPGCSLALVEGNVRVGGELAVSHISGEAASSEDGESEGNYFLGEELGAAVSGHIPSFAHVTNASRALRQVPKRFSYVPAENEELSFVRS